MAGIWSRTREKCGFLFAESKLPFGMMLQAVFIRTRPIHAEIGGVLHPARRDANAP